MSIQCMTEVWKKSVHSGTNLLMMIALADHSDDDGNSYPAVASLARKCRMQPRNANYILRALANSGELRILVNEGPRGTNRYRIMLNALGKSKTLQPIAPLQRGAPLQPIAPLQRGAPLQPIAPLQRGAPLQPIAPTPAMDCAKPLQPIADETSLNRQEPSGRQKSKIPACPYDAIRDLYHQALPELPAIRLMGDDRKKAIGAFWKWVFTEPKTDGTPRATTAEGALAWIGKYLTRARDNDFIMGRTARGAEHKNWRPDIDFLFSSKGKRQVIEKTGGAA
jgi:hypothetical protein